MNRLVMIMEKFTEQEKISVEYLANLKVIELDTSIITAEQKVGADVDTLKMLKEHYSCIIEKVRKM